jgi:P4 family phage/plasmid primase-like protien
MNSAISNFLKDHYVEGVFATHVSMTNPKGSYQFYRDSYDTFWNIYCKELMEKGDKLICGLAEKPQTYLPVLVDVDIKKSQAEMDSFNIEINEKGEEHMYSEKNLKDVVQIYQSVLRNIVEDCTDNHLLCVVLEKPMYYIVKNGIKIYKSGIHYQFPNCFLSKVEQETHLLPRVKQALKEMNVFENLDIEDSSSVIDENYTKTPWLIYGCRKDGENMVPYKFSKIINSEGNEISLNEAFKYYSIYDVKEQLVDIKGKIQENLPRILSILPNGRMCSELKYGLPLLKKDKFINNEKPTNSLDNYIKETKTEQLRVAKKLLPMLSDFRADDRNEWLTIGWILYNISDGCADGLELWIDFSSRNEEKFDENECVNQWEKMTKKDLSIRTLHYFAKIDNEEMYKEFKREQGEKHIKESLEGSHNDIAKLLFTEYGTEFVCSSIVNRTWYQFKNHHWEEIEEGNCLRQLISSEIVSLYSKQGGEMFAQKALADKTEESFYQLRIKQLSKLISNLKNSPFKSNIMKEACEVFYNKNFSEKLNTNPYLIGFKNGVYDLKLNLFRAGRPEDYISKYMRINYINFNNTDERVINVYDYLEKVFPDTSVRQYFLDTTSDVFEGGNKQKIIIFWTGDGDNGKSVTQTIIERMLGEYAVKFSTTLVTGKKASIGAASPELSRAGGGVRWAVLEEPDGDEELNIGILKALSGNDSYWARDLFEKGKSVREIIPLFKLIFICNTLPNLRKSDPAFWNRAKVIPFESTFVRAGNPCPATYEEQLFQKRFHMDTEFYKKIPDMLEPFAWLLLEHRKNIQGKGRIEPEKVRIATEMYRKQNDIYRQFVDECIVESNSHITILQLYTTFRDWFKLGFPGHQLPVKNEIQEYFTKLWNEPEKGIKWFGYRIRTLDEEIEDGTAVILSDEDLINYDDTKSVSGNSVSSNNSDSKLNKLLPANK